MLPVGESNFHAFLWLKDWLDYQDKDPKGNLIWCNVASKKEVWRLYKSYETTNSRPFVSYEAFIAVWTASFPNAKVRKFVGIMGKCQTCCDIDELHQRQSSRLVEKALQAVHINHMNGCIMRERAMYVL